MEFRKREFPFSAFFFGSKKRKIKNFFIFLYFSSISPPSYLLFPFSDYAKGEPSSFFPPAIFFFSFLFCSFVLPLERAKKILNMNPPHRWHRRLLHRWRRQHLQRAGARNGAPGRQRVHRRAQRGEDGEHGARHCHGARRRARARHRRRRRARCRAAARRGRAVRGGAGRDWLSDVRPSSLFSFLFISLFKWEFFFSLSAHIVLLFYAFLFFYLCFTFFSVEPHRLGGAFLFFIFYLNFFSFSLLLRKGEIFYEDGGFF